MSYDIELLAATSVTEVQAAIQEISSQNGWDMHSMKGLVSCLPVIVKHAEKLGEVKDLAGAEKQALAISIILRLVKLPWWLPVSVVRPLLEGAVNAVVDAFKQKF